MGHDQVFVVEMDVRSDAGAGTWRLGVCGPLDLSVVETLSRLALAARRMGMSLHLRDPSPALSELLDLCGLDEVVCLEDR